MEVPKKEITLRCSSGTRENPNWTVDGYPDLDANPLVESLSVVSEFSTYLAGMGGPVKLTIQNS